MRLCTFVCLMVVLLHGAKLAQAEGDFSFGYGWSQLSLDGEYGGDLDGWGMAFHFRFPPARDKNGLLLGFGLQFSDYTGSYDLGDTLFTTKTITDVSIFTPQVELAWHQKLFSGFYVEPSVAFGALLATFQPRNIFQDDDFAAGWVIRPGLLLGYQIESLSFGAEATYGFNQIEFEQGIDDTSRELYVGGFLRFGF